MRIYIHVPFCRKRCHYCSFFSTVLPEGEAGNDYVKAYQSGVLSEIELWRERLGRIHIDSVFFGGGTPSLLPKQSIRIILDSLRHNFIMLPGLEITLEGNPESVVEFGYLNTLAENGVNRLSLGVQSLNDNMLKVLGRSHTVREAMYACEIAHNSGIVNINLDLMWGLPGQRLRLWLDDLKQVVSLGVKHLSCYNLTLDENTPMHSAFLRKEFSLPDEREQSSMYAYGADYLESQGFMHYEISNFAHMGYACSHNLDYWEGHDYIGIGPSAVSTLKGRRWSNPAGLDPWLNEVAEHKIGNDYESLDYTTRILELVMLRLRTSRGLRLSAYQQLTGRDFIADNKGLIQGLYSKSMVRVRNGYLSLTSRGMLVSNSILEYLFSSTKEKLDALPTSEKNRLAQNMPDNIRDVAESQNDK